MLRSRILSGELPAGFQLKEEELAAICGVSRTPVREAIRRLENELFIRRTDSQRSYVAEWSEDDVEEIFTLRGMLESYVVRRAARRINEEEVAELAAINDELSALLATDDLDVETYLDLNSRFHSTILRIAASDRVASLLSRLVLQPVIQQTARSYDRTQLDRSLREHREIAAALGNGDADWASALMTAHIRRAFHARENTDTPTAD